MPQSTQITTVISADCSLGIWHGYVVACPAQNFLCIAVNPSHVNIQIGIWWRISNFLAPHFPPARNSFSWYSATAMTQTYFYTYSHQLWQSFKQMDLPFVLRYLGIWRGCVVAHPARNLLLIAVNPSHVTIQTGVWRGAVIAYLALMLLGHLEVHVPHVAHQIPPPAEPPVAVHAPEQ